ncbi:hypothetical protein D9M71_240580 [compost metagenome]
MSEVGKFKLRPPSVEAAPFDDVNDALLTIANLVGAKSTKINNETGGAEFTIPVIDGAPVIFTAEVGQIVVKADGILSVMSKDEFNTAYERY